MPRIETACAPTIEAMLEVIRREPTSPEAKETAWALWLRVMGDVENRIARKRPPANVDPTDFRGDALDRAERRFLRNVFRCRGEVSLPGLLSRIANHSFIDAIRRHKVYSKWHVPLPGPVDSEHGPGQDVPYIGAASEPDAEFGESRVDPALAAELEERSLRILGALRALGSRSPHSLRVAKAVLWRIVEDRPRSEIAEALGISERQVDRDIAEGKDALKELLSVMTPDRNVVEP